MVELVLLNDLSNKQTYTYQPHLNTRYTHIFAKILLGLAHLLDVGIHGHRFEGAHYLRAQSGEVRVCQAFVSGQAAVRVEVQHALQQRESLLACRGVQVDQRLSVLKCRV